MRLRTLPLRVKLIAAMLIPLAVVGGLLGVQVNSALDQRGNAQDQRAEIDRFQAVVAYASAVGAEGRTTGGPTTTPESLVEQRAAVDAAWAIVADPATDVDPDQLARLTEISNEVADLREQAGTVPFAFRATLRVRGEEAESRSAALIARYGRLQNEVLDLFDFDRSSINDAPQAQALNEFELIERIKTNLAQEQATLLGVWSLADETLRSSEVQAIRNGTIRTDESIQIYETLASVDSRATFEKMLDSESYANYESLRIESRSAQTGDSTTKLNIADVYRRINEGNKAFDAYEATSSAAVETLSVELYQDANGALQRAAAIAVGLLVLMGVILFGLYQSIRRPLRNLTKQSRRVAEHDLPDVVNAMRRGDIETIPQIEEIEATTNDEIGDLVAAFNGMHRTAVELAAEQAASRRVVADMFVNLGRRNHKLLNRMLKGLTLLEREEQDPDKLGALYQVDHLATRMRRNAESLLILAGARQTRSWDKSVPVYDVINSSLAEVENYERVDVDTSEDELVKGEYVADLAHMIAELTENALVFSPPRSRVEITAQPSRRGFAIVVNDSGIGMPADELAAANQRIADAGVQEETPSEFLGHYVVGRLAARHGFTVELFESATGTSARILVPDAIFERVEAVDEDPYDAAELFRAPDETTLVADDAVTPQAEAIETASTDSDVNEEHDVDEDRADVVVGDHEDAVGEATANDADGDVTEDITAEIDLDATFADQVDDDLTADVDARTDETATDEKPEPVLYADASQPLVSPDAMPQRNGARLPDAEREERSDPDDHEHSIAMPPGGLPNRIPAPTINAKQRAEPETVGAGAFAVRRRKGANLPVTTISARPPAETDLGDPDAVRSSLSGFQSGTKQADKEND